MESRGIRSGKMGDDGEGGSGDARVVRIVKEARLLRVTRWVRLTRMARVVRLTRVTKLVSKRRRIPTNTDKNIPGNTAPGNTICTSCMVSRETFSCLPESPDASRDEVAGNIRTRGKTKLTGFPRDHTLSVLLYI